MATAAAITAATTFAMLMAVIVAMAAAATVVTVVMIVVVAVRAVNVAVSQFFFSRFADSNNFHVEFQILASQHVVAINHNVVVFNFGDFNRNRTLVGFSQEAHADLQLVNTMNTSFGTRCTRFSSY